MPRRFGYGEEDWDSSAGTRSEELAFIPKVPKTGLLETALQLPATGGHKSDVKGTGF